MDFGTLQGQKQNDAYLDQSNPFNGELSGKRNIRTAVASAAEQHEQQFGPIDLFSHNQPPSRQPQKISASINPPLANRTTAINKFSHLHHHQQQHHNNWRQGPNSLVFTGLRLQPPQQQQNGVAFSSLNDDIAVLVKQRRNEIDRLLLTQGERLRRDLAGTRRRHYRAMAAAAELSAGRWLREKEAEVEQATRRKADLEERIARLEAESAAWQAKVRADEATVESLQAQLHQAAAIVDDLAGSEAESVCVDPRRGTEGEEAGGGPAEACRRCGQMVATVVVLPCRHLCVCRSCKSAVEACPVCSCVRSASVEVNVS